MTDNELKELIEDCCNDIFDRLEPLANVKSRLYDSLKPSINCSSLEDLEHLISWNLTKNHTDRYGVIKGRHSANYAYMNEDKEDVLKWLKDNYRQK